MIKKMEKTTGLVHSGLCTHRLARRCQRRRWTRRRAPRAAAAEAARRRARRARRRAAPAGLGRMGDPLRGGTRDARPGQDCLLQDKAPRRLAGGGGLVRHGPAAGPTGPRGVGAAPHVSSVRAPRGVEGGKGGCTVIRAACDTRSHATPRRTGTYAASPSRRRSAPRWHDSSAAALQSAPKAAGPSGASERRNGSGMATMLGASHCVA